MKKFAAWMQDSKRVEAHYGNKWNLWAWLFNAALFVSNTK